MDDDMNPIQGERLRRLLDAAAQLPRETPPPADAWNAIRRRIDAQRVVAIAPGLERRARRGLQWWPIATAATVLLMVGFFFAMRGRGKAAPADVAGGANDVPRLAVPTPYPESRDSVRGPVRAVTSVPATLASSNPALAAAIEQYRQAVRELESAVAARTEALPPQTREVVRRSLATIDAAIADLRTALGNDPANTTVGQYLTAVYEQKLDFLKRVRAMPGAGM